MCTWYFCGCYVFSTLCFLWCVFGHFRFCPSSVGVTLQGKKKGPSAPPSVGPFAGVEPWVYFNVGGDQTKHMLEEVCVFREPTGLA